jgi:tRNA 5-methylaminomethyl-2-thiouridine biosynthesis bifunctional protein
MNKCITYAEVSQNDDGNLFSTQFNDIYFDKDDGYQESLHVFFKTNDIPNRWAGNDDFTIFETGFGTGLNFLIAQSLWAKHGGNKKLHFASVEKYLLTEKDMEYAWQYFPAELTTNKEEFFSQYKNLTNGLNILEFGDIKLSLFVGDIEEFLPEISTKIGLIDSWFLDGFAPSKNPEMWQESLCNTMIKNTVKNGTFSTFTVAGFVRRGLRDAGFEVEKVAGIGHKLEILRGRKTWI